MKTVVDRPGYFGKRRAKKVEFYDVLFGEGNWEECWEIDKHICPFAKAVSYYDDAYFEYLKAHPDMVKYVISFGECFDNDPANIRCGCQHDLAACPRHIQDISVRRALQKLGVWFTGPADSLLEIRGEKSNGFHLNPGNVPFHLPELILTGEHAGPVTHWAHPHSIEALWQANKLIVAETVYEMV